MQGDAVQRGTAEAQWIINTELFSDFSQNVMAENQEQRAAVKLCFLLEKNAAETLEMIQKAYKESALSVFSN